MQWMKQNKSRIMDFFCRQDRDNDGKVTRAEFIEGILRSGIQIYMFTFIWSFGVEIGYHISGFRLKSGENSSYTNQKVIFPAFDIGILCF